VTGEFSTWEGHGIWCVLYHFSLLPNDPDTLLARSVEELIRVAHKLTRDSIDGRMDSGLGAILWRRECHNILSTNKLLWPSIGRGPIYQQTCVWSNATRSFTSNPRYRKTPSTSGYLLFQIRCWRTLPSFYSSTSVTFFGRNWPLGSSWCGILCRMEIGQMIMRTRRAVSNAVGYASCDLLVWCRWIDLRKKFGAQSFLRLV